MVIFETSKYLLYCIMITSSANRDSFHALNPNSNLSANPKYIFIRFNFVSVHILHISLHIFPVISKFSQRYWYSRCTVLRRTITLCVKLLITCKLCSVCNSIKASGSSGRCKYSYVLTCPSIGLRRTFTYCSLAALARKSIA